MQSICTPAFEASYSASIICVSTSELILMMIRPGAPARALPVSRSTSSRNRDAEGHRRDEQATEHPLAGEPGQQLNRSVTSAPSSSRQESRPMSVYERAVFEL